MWRLLMLVTLLASADDSFDKDGESSRKVLGSSVVTSVSVIMDAGNGSKIYADAVGRPMKKPSTASEVASPINLLNPDRYEFYTFDDTGDLVKRLMTMEEIQDIIATGDGDGFTLDSFTSNGFVPEKRVNDVVNNVQNVLKEEMKTHKDPAVKPQFDTPDVSDSWSMILPAVFGNSGEDIKPEPPITHVTPDTIMIEPTVMVTSTTEQISTAEKVQTLQTKKTTQKTSTTTAKTPMINVEIITNSNSTTEKTITVLGADTSKIVEIKPLNTFEMTKENVKPFLHITSQKGTKKPIPIKATTFRPTRSTPSPQTIKLTPKTPTTIKSTTVKTTSTTQALKDAVAEASTTLFEKIAPPRVPTTAEQTTTTELPPTTTTFQSSEPPTTTEAITSTTESVPSTFEAMEKKVPTTVLPDLTTYGSLSTFFMVENNKATPEANTGSTSDDLNTLSTEYITLRTITAGKVPNSSVVSTTEYQQTDKTTTNLLDKFLLTSTNIYEINSELSDSTQTTIANENLEDTTTDYKTTEKFLNKLRNPTEPPEVTTTTTDRTFIDTIEQIMSQTIAGTPAPPIAMEKEALKVHEMMMNSTNKTIPQIMMEAATFASSLMDSTLMDQTTEVPTSTTVPTTTMDDTLLKDSMNSLLSQVYGQGVTTVEDNIVSTTTTFPESTTSESTTFIPHIINITIIKNEVKINQTKPAKSDLSLEMDYEDMIKEIKKNSSLASMIPHQEILKSEASSSIHEQNFEVSATQEPTTIVVSTTEEFTTTETPVTTTTAPTTTPTSITSTTSTTTKSPKPSVVITVNENKTKTDEEETNWTLVSTVAPPNEVKTDTVTEEGTTTSTAEPPTIDLAPKPLQGYGLDDTTSKLDSDINQFVQLCNELAFGFWRSINTGVNSARSIIVSPFAATSMLAMVFLGARGGTSGEMNEILKLDDMVTFNPHLIFKNVSESIETGPESGVSVSVIIRQLYSDRSRGKLLGFYKERVRQFYDGHVEEVSFKEVGDIIRRRTNLLVKKNTNGKIVEFLKDGSIVPKPPLAGISVSIFHTDCSQASTSGADAHLPFLLASGRRAAVPAAAFSSFLAGYEPSLDATAAALVSPGVAVVLVMPGRGADLARLEKRLAESAFAGGAWARLLRALVPRPGARLHVPRLRHRSVLNATRALRRMGLRRLFDASGADLRGLGADLHLSDVLQANEFAVCAEKGAHAEARGLPPMALRPRQGRLPEPPTLRFDRPFLYFVRHSPSGMILHMGRFQPRLLP